MTSRRSLPAAALLLLAPVAVHALEPPSGDRRAQPRPAAAAAPATGGEGSAVGPARSSGDEARRARWQVLETVGDDRRPRLVVLAPPDRLVEHGAPISLSVKDADLVEVVRSLARIAGLNLVLDPSVRGTVTAELTDVPWDQALGVILKINGLGMELDGRIITVAPPARLYAAP